MKKTINDKYKTICHSYKLEPKPQIISYFEDTTNDNDNSEEEVLVLDFPGNIPANFKHKITNEDIHPLLSSLISHASTIIKIDLSYNLLSPKCGIYLQKLFDITENICVINLRGNQLSDVTVDLFISSLLKKPLLSSLDLNSNHIGNTGVFKINDLLIHNTNLELLNLGHNLFDWDGIIAVCTSLKITNRSLKVLNLDDPAYKHVDQDFFTHLGKMFLNNKSLAKLSLRFHHIKFDGTKILFHHLNNNKSLRVLDLSANSICFQGMVHISVFLSDNKSLLSLVLAHNQIHNQGAKTLAYGLSQNKCLLHLDITNNGIKNDGLLRIAEGLNENSTLKSLKIFKDNFWGIEAIMSFQEVLSTKDEFYQDFEIYEDMSPDKELQICYREYRIENEEDFLVPN